MVRYCNRCGGFKWRDTPEHGCRLLDKVWEPDCGETEKDAEEVWSLITDPNEALDRWCERRDSDNAMEAFQHPQTVAFRTTEGDLRFLTITREFEPTYHVEEADEDEVERISAALKTEGREG